MTTFSLGSTYHGFTLDRVSFVEEINSTVYLFTHAVLGFARPWRSRIRTRTRPSASPSALYLKTPPALAHILEHSVLMGSEKYPVKDVFGEINKGGLMTFLNAMTGADTTWYPFATRKPQGVLQHHGCLLRRGVQPRSCFAPPLSRKAGTITWRTRRTSCSSWGWCSTR